MRQWIAAAVLTGGCGLFVAGSALAYNSVWVESKSVQPSASGVTINVWVVNSTPLTGFALPLEFRTVVGGAYIAGSCAFNHPSGNRIRLSPIGVGMPTQSTLGVPLGEGELCPPTRPRCGDLAYSSTPNPVDFVSPDGFLWAGFSTAGPPDLYYLPAGSDSVAGTFTDWPAEGESTPYPAGGSYNFVFNVNSSPGQFEIDTVCVCPDNHLVGTDLAVREVLFGFTKGVITVSGSAVRSLETGDNVPTSYVLEQNYPNPFNASTVVRFSMPHDGRVRLEVFNILGRKVRTLLDDFKPLGLYAVDWDGTDDGGAPVSTGVYFYRIQTADYSKTRSMLLLK